jgi:spermidine synthase
MPKPPLPAPGADALKNDLRLYINGNLQFSSHDEHRYHEALVHPVLGAPWARQVLILGGGDGLAARGAEIPNVQHITLVDLDPAMTTLFRTSAPLVALNGGSLNNPRLSVVNQDAARWLEQHEAVFDAIIVDFPDPSNLRWASCTRCRCTGCCHAIWRTTVWR